MEKRLTELLTIKELNARLDAFTEAITAYVAAGHRHRNGNLSPELNFEREAIVHALADASARHSAAWEFNTRNILYAFIHCVELTQVIQSGNKEAWVYETGRDQQWLADARTSLAHMRDALLDYRQKIADELERTAIHGTGGAAQ